MEIIVLRRTTLFYNEALDEQWKEDEPRLILMFQYYNINITETGTLIGTGALINQKTNSRGVLIREGRLLVPGH